MDQKTIKGTIGSAIFRDEAVHFVYITPKRVSTRLVMPYRWRSVNSFIGLDFGRDDLREFVTTKISRIRMIRANEVFPPFFMLEVDF